MLAPSRAGFDDAASGSVLDSIHPYLRGAAARTWLVVVLLALMGLAALRTERSFVGSGPRTPERWRMMDFRTSVYYPPRALLAGDNPYDPAVVRARYPVDGVFPLYAPTHLLLSMPLALLPFGMAATLFFALNLALVPVFAALVLRLCRRPLSAEAVLLLSVLMMASRPLLHTLSLGQITLPVVAGFVAALVHARSRPWLGGAGLALAAVKPTAGVPLALLMLCRREGRAVARGLLLLALSNGGMRPLLESFAENLRHFAASRANQAELSPTRIDALVAISRLLGVEATALTALVVALVVLGTSGLLMSRLARRGAGPEADLLLCLASLVAVHRQHYDALLLFAPLALVWVGVPDRGGRAPLGLRTALVAALLVPLYNYFGSLTVLGRLEIGSLAWRLVSSASSVSLLAAWLIALGLALRATGPREGGAPGARARDPVMT